MRSPRFRAVHASCDLLIPNLLMLERIADELAIVKSIDRDPSEGNVRRLRELHRDRHVSRIVANATGMGLAERRGRRAGLTALCNHYATAMIAPDSPP